ncbi:type IV pilus biogenesis protein PilO [Yersinia frederiksenii]|uniref:Type IV pilus biogenesis protein PilO n=2 Tax=Yersinia frederiksenii TaxID=29484 RepID=A0A380PVC1_YERFR|nr:type IV pilus biogenesis protein PilO [Yersinia frederiksenii]SUP77488.1 type IV pilus biogenesis protein PilO [Yersinia frederiksenii]
MMNKQLQRWMDLPGWQLCLCQWGLLGLLYVTVYSAVLRPEWQRRQLIADEVTLHQQQVEQQQSALAQLPSLLLLRQKVNELSAIEISQQQSSIAHLVGKWITPYGGRVIGWRRELRQESEAVVDSVGYQQWQATLQVNFYGLLHLLRQLSSISSPVQVQRIEIMRDRHRLTVKLNLKEYLVGSANE